MIFVQELLTAADGKRTNDFRNSCILHDETGPAKKIKVQRTSRTPIEVDAWFRTTLYSIGDAVITTDRTGRILQMNPVAERLTGWKESKACGRKLPTVFRIVNDETRKKVENPVQRVLREGTVVGLANHTLLIRKDGTEIPIADSGVPIFDDQKNVAGVVLVFLDQTSERKAQRLVRDAREFAESIVATIREPLLVLDESLEVVGAYDAFYRVFAVQPEETIGKKLFKLGKGQWNIPKLRSLLEDILPSNSHFENYAVEHDFEQIGTRTMMLNASRLQRSEGRSGLILLAIEDVTERRQAERDKAQAEERFTHISQLITDFAYAFRVRPNGTLQGEWISDSFTKTFGYTIADIDARGGWQSLLHPDDAQIAWRHAQKVIAGEPDVCEMRFLTRTGSARWLRDVAVPVWNEHHTRVVRIYGAAEDITERKEAEQALRAKEERLRTILETEPECVKVLSLGGMLIQMNPAGLRMIEAESLEQVVGKPVFYLVAPEHQDAFKDLTARVLRGESANLQFEIIGLKGTRRWLETHAVPLRDDQQRIIAVLGITRDITEAKRAADAIRQSEEQFRALAESSLAGIYLFQENIFRYVNPAFEQIFGYGPGEIVGKLGPIDLTHPDDRPLVQENVRRREQGEIANIRYEFRGVRKDGSIIFVKVHGTRLPYQGKPAIIGTLIDITEWRRASEQITMLAHALRRVEECVSMTEMDEYLIFVNEAFQKTYGYTESELLRKHITILRSPHNDAGVLREILPSTLQRGGWRGELMNRRKDGTDFPIFLSTSLVKDDQGKPVALIGVANDITERMKGEQALRESEEKFRTVAETAATAIFIYQAETFRYVNRYATSLTGYTEDDLLKMKFCEIIHPEHRELVRQRGLARQQGKDVPPRYEFTIVTKNGDVRCLDFTAGVIQFQGERAAVGTAFDITDRKNAEEALRRSKEPYRMFFEQDLTADYIVARDGTVLMCNPAFVRLFGFASEDEAMRANITQLYPSPEKRNGLLERLKTERALKYYPFELRRRDGSPVFVIANTLSASSTLRVSWKRCRHISSTTRRASCSKINSARHKRWRVSARSQAALHTTSTTSWVSFWAMPRCWSKPQEIGRR